MSLLKQQNILFKKHIKPDGSFLGEIQLSRPKKLNALSLDMILSLGERLREWRDDPSVSLIFLHGAGGRGFCAGGDVLSMRAKIQEAKARGEDPGLAVRPFFETEYKTNYMMSRYPKPIVVWGHGIVMGGGLGLFAAASHAVAAESSLFAMPEISIGLFPDVGGSFFLSRLPHGLGWYLGLAACRFNAAEARFLGFCRWVLRDQDKEDLFQFLLSVPVSGSSRDSLPWESRFGRHLKSFQKKRLPAAGGENWLKARQEEISRLVDSKDILAIYESFKRSRIKDKKWRKNRESFLKGSPSSAGVICEQLRRGESMSLKEAFEMELILACQCARRHDFPEGARALLAEKTGSPVWQPPSVRELTDSWIQGHFEPPPLWQPPAF